MLVKGEHSMRIVHCVLCWILVLAAQPAAAQSSAKQPEEKITIVGQRLKDFLGSYVASVTQIGPTDQLAHWDRQICPKIIGIDKSQADYVAKRMALIAREVKLRTGQQICSTMLTIVVTKDAPMLAQVIAEDFPTDNWQIRSALRKFMNARGPVRWISLVDECGGGCELRNTRLSKATQPRLQAMIILVDSTRIGGVSIGQLADYLSLVALTNPPVDAPTDRRSILGLFGGTQEVPAQTELTNVDLSLLMSLYNIREEFGASQQRESMVSQMARQLRREGDPPALPKSHN